MKCEVTTTSRFYDTQGKEELEQLGFEFEEIGLPDDYPGSRWKRKDVPVILVFNSLDDLLTFSKKWGEIIISPSWKAQKAQTIQIEIYDYYRE